MIVTPYYQDDACTIYHGDCRDLMSLLPAQAVQLICVDPPYFRVKDETWDRQWQSKAAYLDWLRGLCGEWQRLLMPNGSLYCFASPEMATQVELVIQESFHFLNRIVWCKPDGWAPESQKGRTSQLSVTLGSNTVC